MPNYNEFEYELSDKEIKSRKAYALGYRLASGKSLSNQANKNWKPFDIERNKQEYVYFDRFPQFIKSRKVSIVEDLGNSLHKGNDGNIYYKFEDADKNKPTHGGSFAYAYQCSYRINSYAPRFSDGQKSDKGTYFK